MVDLVPEGDGRIQQWAVAGDRILVSYIRRTAIEISIFDLEGNRTGELPIRAGETVRITGASPENDEIFLESESFYRAVAIHRYSPGEGKLVPWAKKMIPFDCAGYEHVQVRYASKDGTENPHVPAWPP